MDLGLQGKSVLITAASRGLGRACAKELSYAGAIVTIASRDREQLRTTAEEIERETKNKVYFIPMDVTDPNQIQGAVQAAVENGGGIDVLITNSGGPPAGSFERFDDKAWMNAFNLNLLSVIRLIRETLPSMRERGSGRIVNLTSSSIKQPIQNLVLSNTYRAGVHGLTKSLAIELAKDKILVNTVAPGRVATERIAELDKNQAHLKGIDIETVRQQSIANIPVGRYGYSEEFAKAVAFMVSFTQSYITGQALLVDGGMVKSL